MTARPQPIRTVPGQTYGEAGAQEAAQREIPLPDRTRPSRPAAAPQRTPVSRPNVFGPTQRPSEPITAGTESLLPPDPVAHLRALYQRFPHEDLRRLLERAAER